MNQNHIPKRVRRAQSATVAQWAREDSTRQRIMEKVTQTDDRYLIVYRNKNNIVKTYEIGRPDLSESFGNKIEGRRNTGFKAYCYGREAIRSFRHEGIISLTKV